MQRDTERRLAAEALDRVERREIPQADSTMVIDGARYTAAAALEAESASLFRRYPLLVALGCEIPRPGNYLAFDIAGVPVLLVRDDKGSVHGLLNTCRHRGARLLAGEGTVGKAFACPYHGWAYDRCGVLRALPESEHFPEVDVDDTRLMRFPTEERDGLVWLLLDPAASEVPDPGLDALGPELAGYRLSEHIRRGSHTWTKRMNWKLGIDTFLELHHVAVLHRQTIAKTILRQAFLYEPFGQHARLVAPRRSIEDQRCEDPANWRLVPHATIIYRLFPNAVLLSQGPHMELYRFFPDPEQPGTTECRITFSSPADDTSVRDWEEVLALVLGVLDREDFAMMESVQSNLAAGLQREVMFGRNEIGLQNFHRVRDAALIE